MCVCVYVCVYGVCTKHGAAGRIISNVILCDYVTTICVPGCVLHPTFEVYTQGHMVCSSCLNILYVYKSLLEKLGTVKEMI